MLNLFDVFTSGSKVRTEQCKYDKEFFDLTGVSYPIKRKSPVDLKFKAIEVGKVNLTGSFNMTLEIPCDRCLEPVLVDIECDIDYELLSEEQRSRVDEAEDMSFLQGNEFDVFEFIDLCVLMNMPSKVLCKDDCKGICPVCGQNRNLTDCGCDSFVPDPRMAAIADIFNASKEV